MTSVDDLRPGQKGRVLSLSNFEETAQKRLLDRGLFLGSVVLFVRRAPLGNPICVEMRGAQFMLRREMARKIEIERVGL